MTIVVGLIAVLMLSYLIVVIFRYELEQRRCKKQDVANSIKSRQSLTDKPIDIKDFEYQAIGTNTETKR